MYVPEPCVKFGCARCGAWVTAPQQSRSVLCPACGQYQPAAPDRMRHFSIGGRRVCFGETEWLSNAEGKERLDAERARLDARVRGLATALLLLPGRARAVSEQRKAIDAAKALCERVSIAPQREER